MPSDYHISLISVQKSHFLYLICYHYYHLFFHLLFISHFRVPYNAFLQQSILDFRAIREEGKSNEIELLCQTPILSFVSARRCAKIFLYRNQSLIVDLYQTKEPLKCNKAQNQMNPNQSLFIVQRARKCARVLQIVFQQNFAETKKQHCFGQILTRSILGDVSQVGGTPLYINIIHDCRIAVCPHAICL